MTEGKCWRNLFLSFWTIGVGIPSTTSKYLKPLFMKAWMGCWILRSDVVRSSTGGVTCNYFRILFKIKTDSEVILILFHTLQRAVRSRCLLFTRNSAVISRGGFTSDASLYCWWSSFIFSFKFTIYWQEANTSAKRDGPFKLYSVTMAYRLYSPMQNYSIQKQWRIILFMVYQCL